MAYFWFEFINLIKLSNINELFDYPGWILPVTKMFFFYLFCSWLVICKRGISTPNNDFPREWIKHIDFGN
jgi:hypothetical protein